MKSKMKGLPAVTIQSLNSPSEKALSNYIRMLANKAQVYKLSKENCNEKCKP